MELLPETSKTVNGGVAWDINDSDQNIGSLRIKKDVWSAPQGIDHAMLWRNGEVIDLHLLARRKKVAGRGYGT